MEPSEKLGDLRARLEKAGGVLLSAYREPLGGQETWFVCLPVEAVEPTPFQRALSEAHSKRLRDVVDKIGRFLDPVILTAGDEKMPFWTPNGNHRLNALKCLGAKTVTALLIPDAEVAYKILALNTEKAHNIREKSLEVIRMYRAMAEKEDPKESDLALEFEQPYFITLGLCYEGNGRFSGGAYQSVLRKTDAFFDRKLKDALEERKERAALLQKVDARVSEIVDQLKAKGLKSPYLRAFVVARVNPLAFSKREKAPFDATFAKMLEKAESFGVDKVRQDHLAGAAGAPDEV